ncbi:MAG: hypothetical protein JO224_01735 [Pelomonas sp.]|nr:hypothetical protein [Roseateles sp.]
MNAQHSPRLAPTLVLLAAMLGGLGGVAARADSTASSASDSASSAASSTSDSLEDSSHSSGRSSGGDRHFAAGTYEVVAMAPNAARAGTLRVHLAQLGTGDAPAEAFDLILPEAAAQRGALAVGAHVDVRARPYGYAFAREAVDAPFFLALDDARGLALRAVAAS